MSVAPQSVVCRVQNLTSPKGQNLNGLAASFDPTASPQSGGRLAVSVDGVRGPRLSIKPENPYFLKTGQQSFENLAVAVGRQDLRSQDFMATVVDQRRGRRVTSQILSSSSSSPVAGEDGGRAALRSQGTLKALLEYFQTQQVSRSGDILIHVTDLNLALLLNSYAYAKENVTKKSLDSEQQALAKTVGKHISRHSNNNRVILFKYEPFRIYRNEKNPKDMVTAALEAKFHIYPCPCEAYLDALEVRFLAPGRSTHSLF